jgi:formylglycine-generating enzyme required for sulfatase activity
MWQATVSYLKLNPRHAKIAGMQQQLEAPIQKSPLKYAAFGELAGFWPTQPSAVLSKLPADVLSSINRDLPLSSNSIGMKFKPIIGGTFTMSEATQVTLTQPFELGVYEVTQEQYEQVMGTNPSNFKGSQNPVEQVSWDDAVEFCRKLSALPAEKKAGYLYRLPTEAEWEYACRAESPDDFCFGNDVDRLGEYAWYNKNSENQLQPVGAKQANNWGLHDMHGNVWEWCQDWHGNYSTDMMVDPAGPSDGSLRVLRGGCWLLSSQHARSAYRNRNSPGYRDFYLGFRVAAVPATGEGGASSDG